MKMKREKATPTIPWSDAVDGPNNELNNGCVADVTMTSLVLNSQDGQ